MLPKLQIRRLKQPKVSLVSSPLLSKPRCAHSWSPVVASVLPNGGAPLAFFDSYHAPRRREESSLTTSQSQALYGQLVVSALLNPVAQARLTRYSESEGEGEQPTRSPEQQDSGEISDQEWEIRTGEHYLLDYTPTLCSPGEV